MAQVNQSLTTKVLLGPLIARLKAALKAKTDGEQVHWFPVSNGHLALGHRPKKKSIPTFRDQGTTHILTLLSEGEGALEIGKAVEQAGIAWLWFPLESATAPKADQDLAFLQLYLKLRDTLAGIGRIYIHCSAGIHRTGMIAFGLLRNVGFSVEQAKVALQSLRSETSAGVGEERLNWGNRFARVTDA